MNPYQQKATEIIKQAIKSAIFIDEKAKEFYSPDESNALEHQLSIDLFNNFKNQGISLTVHKYSKGDEVNSSLKDYLFEDRDLVLLDWKLDGEQGEEFALQLLADIVNRPHIHFCAIYTSASDFKRIFLNILSFFSSKTKDDYYNIKSSLLSEEEMIGEMEDFLNTISLYRFDIERRKQLIGNFMGKNEHREFLKYLRREIGIKDTICALLHVGIAFSNFIKSDEKNPSPEVISFDTNTLVINNTIITILKKDENEPINLVSKLSEQIIASTNSFTQLLGLEMQNIFSQNSSFIDGNLLKVSKEAILFHRNQFKQDNLTEYFQEFIKEIMLEKVNLDLRNKDLSLLEDNFLDSFEKIDPKDEELLAMNIFYNSTQLKSDSRINFGDIFEVDRSDKKEYYICITALCDCIRSESKLDNNFFFAKGTLISKAKALTLGDTAFISYLSLKEIVVWTEVGSTSGFDNYKPKYIKPLVFNVTTPLFDENNTVKFNFLDKDGINQELLGTYKTTIKANYAQRIANHAFAYPMRVGVDFVKKGIKKK